LDIKKLTNTISVADQISEADLTEIAQAGFKSLICNRPDGEGSDQPGFKEIEIAAKALGLAIRYLPAGRYRIASPSALAAISISLKPG